MRALLLLLFLKQAWASEYLDEFEKCRTEEDFGKSSLVCDSSKRLGDATKRKLGDMLQGLQKRIKCECEGGCRRADGRDGFIGLLHVTTNDSTSDLKADMAEEYRLAELGNASCSHGLVLVYLKDTLQLATFRGGDSFVLLTDEDMEKLHTMAAKGGEGDTLALQYLLSNYKDVVENPIQRAESWMPLLGLILAALIVLCIVGCLLSLFVARCCCCCAKRKKDVYHVSTIPTYKSIEPLYVVTPPNGMHGTMNRAMSDAIYSTPYSGSPIPYPSTPLPFPPPPGSSMPVTPVSSGRNRVIQETPVLKRKEKNARSEPGSLRRTDRETDIYSTPPEGYYHRPPSISSPIGIPSHEIYGTIPRATLTPRTHSLPSPGTPVTTPTGPLGFLDPKRRQETQTREEYVY